MYRTKPEKSLHDGVYGFFFLPETGTYIEFPWLGSDGHNGYVKKHPDEFGVTLDELNFECEAVRHGIETGSIPKRAYEARVGQGIEYVQYLTYRYKIVRGVLNHSSHILQVDSWALRDAKSFLQFRFVEQGIRYQSDIIHIDVMMFNGVFKPTAFMLDNQDDLFSFLSPSGKLNRNHMTGVFAEEDDPENDPFDYTSLVESLLD